MVNDLLKITLDPVFENDHKVNLENNTFNLIYSPGNTIFSEKPINKRQSYDLSNLYPISELQDELVTRRLANVKENHQNRIKRITTRSKLSISIDQDNLNNIDDK